MNHKKGYASAAEAIRSKAAGIPGAVIDEKCPCGRVHVDVPKAAKVAKVSAFSAPRPLLTPAVTVVLAGGATVNQAAREFGCDPAKVYDKAWAAAKGMTFSRDDRTCLSCGELAVDCHHRIVRGHGGTGDPVRAFGRQSLCSLCRRCHDLCHAKDKTMRLRGFMLRTSQDPARVPVLVAVEYGVERRWLLPGDGYSLTDPYAEEAAA